MDQCWCLCRWSSFLRLQQYVVFSFARCSSYILAQSFFNTVPEVFRPGGMFDYVLHSHQVWHVAIIVAYVLNQAIGFQERKC